MNVKICGIRGAEEALCAVQNGAKAIGFVFADSKRKIEPEDARVIIDKLPEDVWKVGVFVNETKERIEEIVRISGINVIQLHGDESSKFAKAFQLPVIKAFSIKGAEDLAAIADFQSDYILLDSARERYFGGNGKVFDWNIVKDYDFKGKKVILAGGLNTENVRSASNMVNPFMLDVSSGVETDGKKDLQKIELFLGEAIPTY
ncbi:phosphoribosylanthranilate isomerase [Niallia circulans]|uniref:N-(5'-phosphoribosyl)anthranilate isomerase n=1 Tax=Niallia circulans TaxID=1397 RepID=A0A553SLY3_NIACI|nr:phosphoribosylanthranilate isomerase [Niallia circulans]TRZ38000.1 phosphoribosylanthranilate isomerase [Niallia circulans]